MSLRTDWKAREMGVAEREWRRRDRIAHQRRVEECLAWWETQRNVHRLEPVHAEPAEVAYE